MDGPRNNHARIPTSSSLSPRQLRPVLSQAYIARLFVEANDALWREHGDFPHYWTFDAQAKVWHKCQELGGYLDRHIFDWRTGPQGEPAIDFRPGVFFDLVQIVNPLLEIASPADQRRAGSYNFLNQTIKLLEHHERIVMSSWRDLEEAPRPILEEEMEEVR